MSPRQERRQLVQDCGILCLLHRDPHELGLLGHQRYQDFRQHGACRKPGPVETIRWSVFASMPCTWPSFDLPLTCVGSFDGDCRACGDIRASCEGKGQVHPVVLREKGRWHRPNLSGMSICCEYVMCTVQIRYMHVCICMYCMYLYLSVCIMIYPVCMCLYLYVSERICMYLYVSDSICMYRSWA